MPVGVARIGVTLIWEYGGGGRVAPASIEVAEADAEVDEAEAAVAVTDAFTVPNSPHPSAVAPTSLAIVGAVLESADPIERA